MNLDKASFSLNLGLVKLKGDLAEIDRQCAWELYTELCTRIAVTGKQNDPKCKDFSGEIYAESLESLYRFFQEARAIMREFPVGRLPADQQNHLGVLIHRVMRDVLRPFLEKWQADYRHWWLHESNPKLSPFVRQAKYKNLNMMLADWSQIRYQMRRLQKKLVDVYKLVDVTAKK